MEGMVSDEYGAFLHGLADGAKGIFIRAVGTEGLPDAVCTAVWAIVILVWVVVMDAVFG